MKPRWHRCHECREFPEGATSVYCGTAGAIVGANKVACLYGKARKEIGTMEETKTPAPEYMCACGLDDFKSKHAAQVHVGRSGDPRCAVVEKVPADAPEPGTDRNFDHCDHVERCGITGIAWCGADPCNLVAEWLEGRCDNRTDADCQNDRCHDCPVYPEQEEVVSISVSPMAPRLPDYRLEAIRAWAHLARLYAEMRHSDTLATIDHIIALAGEEA